MSKNSLIIWSILVFLRFIALGQHHGFWPVDTIMIRFNWNGVVSIDDSKANLNSAESSYSSESGDWLYYSSVSNSDIFIGGIYNENNQLIHATTDLNMSRTFSSGKFLPFYGSNSIGFVSQRMNPATLEFQTWYHEIDHSNRQLVKKNIPLNPLGIKNKMGVASIRHGNGRDWWVITRQIFGTGFLVYNCKEGGCELDSVYNIGSYTGIDGFDGGNGWGGGVLADPNGNFIIHFSAEGLIEQMLFNRCTGELRFYRTISPVQTGDKRVQYYGCLSPTGKVLYISNTDKENAYGTIEQYDLSSVDVASSKFIVLNTNPNSNGEPKGIQSTPDGKVYFAYYSSGSLLDTSLRYLHTINNPDVMGTGCGLQLKAVYLNGKQFIKANLPSFSNYYLGAIPNSLCDTLGLSSQNLIQSPSIELYPNPAAEKIYLDWPDGPFHFTLRIFDSSGKLMQQECIQNTGKQNIPLIKYPSGIYMLQVEDEIGRRINRRFGVRGE